ncbi:putative ribonuclease H-like domain-containing protein [Tanacetum coccineum]
MVSRTVLTRPGPISLNAARLVNTVQSRTTVNNAGPMKNVINNAYSTARRPFNKITTANNSNFNKRVNTVNNKNVNAARPNAVVNTARPKAVLSAVKGNKGNVVKASACWVWRPKHKVLDHVSRNNVHQVANPQQDLKNKGVIDNGCSRNMTGNKSYLTNYEEIDGGFVAFRGNSKGGNITRLGKIGTGKLDFEDVYFVKELKFNLYCVSLCDGTRRIDIKMEFSVARTPQQNGVAERKNRTLIEAARTVLADSKLPITFWAEAVNTVCYVQNRVLVIKLHNKTSYKLFLGRKPTLNFIRPFGCPVTILNTIDHLGKFDVKADEGFFVGNSTNSKAFRVFNSRTRIVEENLHVQFRNQSNGNAGTKACDDAGKARMETDSPDARFKPSGDEEKKDVVDTGNKDSKVPINALDPKTSIELPNDLNMPELEDIVYSDDDEDVGAEADMNNLDAFMPASPIPTTGIHKDHLIEQIKEPKKTLMDLPNGKRAIGTKWVYRNKKDEIGIVIKNKARLVAQQYTQEEEIDYDEVFTHVARIEAIRLFLVYALFKDFVVYQMDVKSAFLYGKIKEEVYICQPLGFEDPDFPNRVLERKDRQDFIYQKGQSFSDVKTASTPMETHKPLLKDADGEDVDERLYRSMIGSLMYLTSSRPDIMFAVCACARFQVNPKNSHLHAVKKIFRYLKGLPKLGLWYPKDSPFDLVAYTDSDYTGASLDKKSTIGAEYIAASNCCRQVIWIQNQLLDYRYNFMQTKIHIDNKSTICIVKNPVFHSKTKHIEIRHHFIRDSNEMKLIQMIKIYTDQNVADLPTKAFDVSRFQYLIASIGMLNL